MIDEYKFWTWLIGCLTIITVVVISCVTYYNIESLNVSITLAKNGVSPVVLDCLKRDWNLSVNNNICKEVLTKLNLTFDEDRN